MKPGGRCLKFWFLASCFSFAASELPTHGVSAGYLRTAGPPALRFRPPPVVRVLTQIPAQQQEAIKPTDLVLTTEMEQSPAPTVPLEPIPQEANPNGESLLPPVMPNPQPSAAPAPANDLLIINPQMLIEYFKTQPGSTNAPVTAIVPVQFMPATPAVVPGSRAIYKTE